MTAASSACYCYYPPRLWGLDSLYWTHVQLNIVDVLELPEFPGQSDLGYYCLGNHPISRVEVMGDVVRLHGKSRNVVFEVDDGTGVISCCLWRHEKDSDDDVPKFGLGQLVTVQGRITLYRGSRQITVAAVHFETDVHAECRHWLELAHLKASVYSKPFVVPEDIPKDSGWNPALAKECESKVEVKEAIVGYLLRENIREFAFADLQEEPLLMAIAADAISTETDVSTDKLTAMIKHVLASATRCLVDEGCLFVTDCSLDRYEVIDHEALVPVVLSTVRDLQMKGDGDNVGVHREAIISALRSRQRLCKVKRETFIQTIENLIKSSELYEVERKRYKLIS
ncbi:CST complex subunit STN1-like [Corticium candelabrum]|uniref:CST complex subunit STN1-like n=1 Tax=Corticium candelabrum TaxID=121492 RepID=UPI002E26361E|nr:CST complex subunit STN1-like [Corticium candelabrum]